MHKKTSMCGKNGHPTEEEVLCQSSCMGFFRLFNNLRKQRGIKLEQLVNGIMTRRMLSTIIKGEGYFSRESWEFLMHRMGALTDYFEAIVSRKELEDWREREDICLLVCESPKEARTKLEAYEKVHPKMTSMAKLFCLKIEWLLKKETASPQVLYGLSCEAVCCTVKEEWQEQLSGLWLAPAELEAILLVSWSLGLLGEVEKALFLFHQVWNYPKKKGWEDRMTQLLCPQAKLLHRQAILLDLLAALADHHAGPGAVQEDGHGVGAALDLDLGHAGAVQGLFQVLADLLILDDQVADLLFTGIPTGIPVFDDAHAQAVGIYFLSHKLLSSLMPFPSQPG